MLRADELEPMKNKEPGWVPEEDDHDCDLQYWHFEVCPDRHHCKKGLLETSSLLELRVGRSVQGLLSPTSHVQ